MKRLVLGLGLVALAVLSAACSGGSGASASAPAASAPAASAPAGDAITLSAKDLKFSTASLTAPADEAFQIVFDNQESAPHNVAIKDAAGAVEFKGEIVTSTHDHVRRPGPRRRRLRVLVRSPSGHEGHAHRRVASLAPRRSGPRPAAQAGVFFVWVSSGPDCRAAGAITGETCSKSSISRNATGRSWRSTARASVPGPGGSSASSGPTAPARRRPCAASSVSPGRIAARSAGRVSRSTARRGCASATCPSSAACIRGCGSASSSRISPSNTASPVATPIRRRRAGWTGWASATAPRPSWRSSRTGTSSASSWPSPWRTTRSCSCWTSRSPASTRSGSRR